MSNRSAYVPLDAQAMVDSHGDEFIQRGETCRIDALKNNFAWMRGFVNAWYGWSNDGKGTFTDFLMVIKSKFDKWKWCLYKQEDMDTVLGRDGKAQIKANGIYYDLAWIFTGKTWDAAFAKRNRTSAMTLKQQMEAMEFIEKHFFVVYPEDRKFKNLMDNFMFMYEKFGVDGFMLDPWNTVRLPDNERGDERMVNAFIDIKEFAMKTNTVFNIISHPRSGIDMRESKAKNAPFKVVNQFMQLGGSAWDIKMDGSYSIFRPNRHIDRNDPNVEFHNLKQRKKERVGVRLGEVSNIMLDEIKRQYYFNDTNPMDGTSRVGPQTIDIFASSEPKKKEEKDDLPF